MIKNTKMVAVPTVVINAKIIEAIAYNITVMVQIQPSMSEPADVSLLLPSSDPLLMKDTKTAVVPTVVIDAKIIEAITYNIAVMAQIQPSMSEPADVSLPLPSVDSLLMKDTKTVAVPRV
jgi:alkyl sulfatase BDS1-like metallo-beta-lactamase superfamily hydrolase